MVKFDYYVEGNNLSDHNPIYIEYRFDNIDNHDYVSDSEDKVVYNWGQATEEHIDCYKQLLDEFLNSMFIPNDILSCRDFSCNDHNVRALEILEISLKS